MIKKSSLGDLIVNTNSRILSISIFFSFLTINLNVSLFRIIYTIFSAMIFSPVLIFVLVNIFSAYDFICSLPFFRGGGVDLKQGRILLFEFEK